MSRRCPLWGYFDGCSNVCFVICIIAVRNPNKSPVFSGKWPGYPGSMTDGGGDQGSRRWPGKERRDSRTGRCGDAWHKWMTQTTDGTDEWHRRIKECAREEQRDVRRREGSGSLSFPPRATKQQTGADRQAQTIYRRRSGRRAAVPPPLSKRSCRRQMPTGCALSPQR